MIRIRNAILWIDAIYAKPILGQMQGVSSRYAPDPAPRMAKPLLLRQVGLARAQFFLRPFSLGDVNHGTHELNQIAGWAENGTPHPVYASNSAAGMNHSGILLESCFHPQC